MKRSFLFKTLPFLALLLPLVQVLNAQSIHKEIQYLSGTDNKNTVTWDFWCTSGRNSGFWSKIQVPSVWEQQGFGTYNYGRDYVTYGKNFRFAEEKGLYAYSFTVPEGWKEKSIQLVFEGSMTDTEVKINGKVAGPTHQGSFYRFTYDVTDKVKIGQPNKIEVTVSKMSTDASVNNAERLADYWIFGGIFRPVYLEATPVQHISHTSIKADADGTFAMNVFLKNVQPGGKLLASIIDAKGKTVGTATATTGTDSVVLMQTNVKKPSLWNAETPNLYQVKVSLQQQGKDIYQTASKFGFRTIEIKKQDGIYVNGVKIKMKGINRHVWWPETGRTVSPEIDLADVKLIKGMNMNAVRTSHYPPDQSFLNYCDSLGLYVLDELAGWQKSYSTKAGTPLVKEMVTRDANHPSIIFWVNGNEGGHNFDLVPEYAKHDLSARPVIHAHHRPGNAFNGIDGNHYEDYYSTKKILADTNIYMVTEFLHAQDDGGAAAGLSDFWDLHWNSKRGAGGFIWALVDEGIVRTDRNGQLDVNAINANDGVVGPHREKEGSYHAIKEIYSPVKITLKELPADFKGQIPVENRYHYTNLKECTYRWELVNFNQPGDQAAGYRSEKNGMISPPSIAPLDKGFLKINLPGDWKNHDALTLAAYDPSGNELYKWTWKIKPNVKLIENLLTTTASTPVVTNETDTSMTLKASGIAVTISKKNGTLQQLTNDFSKPLSFNNGPILVSGEAKLTDFKHFKDGKAYVIESSYSGNLKTVRWKMHPSGWLELFYDYNLDGTYPFAGVSFSYPESYVLSAKWLGEGPYRVWKNRQFGTSLNVWENMYNPTQTGAAPWIFPEFKGYFADIAWMELNTAEGRFIVAAKEDDLFVRLFHFYGLTGPKPQPVLPIGDISFLDRIPPIGGKLAFNISNNTAALGPISEPNVIKGSTQRTLYFYFGTAKPLTENKQFTMPKENILTD